VVQDERDRAGKRNGERLEDPIGQLFPVHGLKAMEVRRIEHAPVPENIDLMRPYRAVRSRIDEIVACNYTD
jgi:hypothetical protein